MVKTLNYAISGMHCTSCAMNIDGGLEDTEGVKEAVASYPKQTKVETFDDENLTEDTIRTIIKKADYDATVTS